MKLTQDTRELSHAQQELMLEALTLRGVITWVAHGDSMLPSITSGSAVTVVHCDPAELKWGEVALCVKGPSWVLHRVLSHDRARRLIYTRGDRTPRSDTPWRYEHVVGVLARVNLHPRDTSRLNEASRLNTHVLRTLFRVSLIPWIYTIRWIHQRDARHLLARLLGGFCVVTYPYYHRLKYSRVR